MSEIVRLMHYDPRWRQEFEQTRSSVLQCCLGWVTDLQHIGSTAIDGMIARPVLDVIATVENDDERDQALAESAALIEGLNFRRMTPPMWAAETIALEKPRSGSPTHRVFLSYRDSPFCRTSVLIRDCLRSDRELSIRFEEMKVARWKQGEGDPERYAEDKSVFFTHLLEQHSNEP
ncbi:MAG: GrpB family protein [Planctomycetota bacterium]